MHKGDSTEEHQGAVTGLFKLKNSWEFGNAYTGVGSKNKLSRATLVQPRTVRQKLDIHSSKGQLKRYNIET